VDIASTYIEAIDLITTKVYDFVTIDISLLDMDPTDRRGIDFIDLLGRLGNLIPYIIISGYVSEHQWPQYPLNLQNVVRKAPLVFLAQYKQR